MLYNIRGALKTCDGSKVLTAWNGIIQTGFGPITDIFLYQPTGIDRYYLGIYKDSTAHLGAPTGLAVVDGGAGGTLPPATYYYKVTALDGAGGETIASLEVNIVNAGNRKNNLSWISLPNATGYNLYRNTVTNTEVFLIKVSTNAYVDDNTAIQGANAPPLADTTQQCQFSKFPGTTYNAGNIIHTFPADPIGALDGTVGGYGGGGGGSGSGIPLPPGSSGGGATPGGGVAGNISPIPYLLQFVNKVILCLGNGYPIYTYDGTTTAAITNSFNAAYPNWQTAVAWSAGDTILPTVNNAGGYLFKATQGGVSGGVNPTFPQTLQGTVADGNVIWQNAGQYTAAPAPRAAAHGLIYAGSLWVFNTNPTTTSDGLDGPSALRMSDINNPNSWNPLNAAHLSKDDGDQGMGMALFTISEQGISPTNSLVLFKSFSTYQVVGVFGSTNFSIQQAKTDLGCIAPRTIQFLPGYGIVRLTHLGVAIFNGVGDQIISEEIRPYLFDNTQDDILSMDWNYAYFAKATQSANPPMFIMAIPVALPTISGAAIAAVAHGGSTLPAGKYYVRVTKVAGSSITVDPIHGGLGQNNESAISPELGPITIAANQAISVTGLALPDSTFSGYRVYFGNGSGLENQSVTTTSTSVEISAPGGAASPDIGVGGLSRLLCYDLVLKAWAIIDLPFTISTFRQFRATGTIPITVSGGYTDATIRRLQGGDTDWDGVAIEFAFRTPEVYANGGTQRLHYRRIIIKGVGDATSISVTPLYNQVTDDSLSPTIYVQGINSFDARVDLLTDAESAACDIKGRGIVEIDSVDWDIREKPMGSPPVMN